MTDANQNTYPHCSACGEHHPREVMCPPHEVRSSKSPCPLCCQGCGLPLTSSTNLLIRSADGVERPWHQECYVQPNAKTDVAMELAKKWITKFGLNIYSPAENIDEDEEKYAISFADLIRPEIEALEAKSERYRAALVSIKREVTAFGFYDARTRNDTIISYVTEALKDG